MERKLIKLFPPYPSECRQRVLSEVEAIAVELTREPIFLIALRSLAARRFISLLLKFLSQSSSYLAICEKQKKNHEIFLEKIFLFTCEIYYIGLNGFPARLITVQPFRNSDKNKLLNFASGNRALGYGTSTTLNFY